MYTRINDRLISENDSTIVLCSGDKWNRYAGDKFGAIWLDDPSHYDANLHKLLEILSGRLRGASGTKVQCWTLTGNEYNDAWETLEQRQDETVDPIGLEIDCVWASTPENPYLNQGARERFKRQYGGTRRNAQALEILPSPRDRSTMGSGVSDTYLRPPTHESDSVRTGGSTGMIPGGGIHAWWPNLVERTVTSWSY